MQTRQQLKRDFLINSDGDESLSDWVTANNIAYCIHCGLYGDFDGDFDRHQSDICNGCRAEIKAIFEDEQS